MIDLKGTITKPPELPFTFGEYIDFIGGRSWQRFSSELVGKGENQRLQRLKRYESVLKGSNMYLNDSSRAEKLILEKMYLKVCLVREVYKRVQDYRSVTRMDFGEVNESTFRVGMEASRVLAPAFWSAFVAVDSNVKKNIAVGDFLVDSRGAGTNKTTGNVDHYDLGALLLRALVVNHKQSKSKLESVLATAMQNIKEIARSDELIDRRAAIYRCFDDAITNKIFCIANLEYQPLSNVSFPGLGMMWKRLLLIALKLCTYKVFEKNAGFELLAMEWFSLKSCLTELDELKKIIREAMLYEPSSVNKDLHSILNSLISDKKWLQESLCLAKDPASAIQQDKAVFPVNTPSNTGGSKPQVSFRDKSTLLSKKPSFTEKDKFSLLAKGADRHQNNQYVDNGVSENVSLKNTVMQSSQFSDNCSSSKW